MDSKSVVPKANRMIRVEDELELDQLNLEDDKTIGSLLREAEMSQEELAKKKAREFFESYEEANRSIMLKELGKKEKAFSYLSNFVQRSDDDEIDCDKILALPGCPDDTEDDRSTRMSETPMRHPDEKRVIAQDLNSNTDQMFF